MRKMSSALLGEKNSSENRNSLILPPGVSGNLHGFCTLCVREIVWTTTKTFNLVKLKIIWWGERRGNTFERIGSSRQSANHLSSKTLLSACYHVNTNNSLFHSYLKNCEPVTIEIFSAKTSDLIGIARVPLSNELHNGLQETLSCKFSSDIVSPRNFKLGKIVISFDINMRRDSESGGQRIIVHSIKTPSEKEIKQQQNKPHKQLTSVRSVKAKNQEIDNKENIKVSGQKKFISFREQKPLLLKGKGCPVPALKSSSTPSSSRRSSKSTAASSISDKATSVTNRAPLKSNSSENMRKLSMINYLSGEPMSQSEEEKILREIIETSPSSSVVEEFDKIDSRPQHTARRAEAASSSSILQINLCSLELNEIGLLEVRSYCSKLSNSKFILKCALTSKLFKAKDLHFLSPVFDAPSKKTTFNKQLVQRARIDRENAASIYLNFGFCVKSIESESAPPPHIIGFTRVNLADIIASKTRYQRKCAIIDEQNLAMGAVIISIQIGNKFSYELENLEGLDYRCNEICEPQRPPSFRLLQQIMNAVSHPSTSNDDCDNHAERHYENKNMQTDSAEAGPKFSQKETSMGDQRDTEMIDVEVTNASNRKSRVFQGLFFVEGLRNVREQQPRHAPESEYFITYEGFWNECHETSELSVNHVFNYLKQFSVMCDEDFLRRVKNNYLELKLWEKTNEVSEKLIGTTRAPLHQFYIAFKDAEMIEHLSTNKLPIISTDTWCNCISPLSSELFCQAKILLAIGSENQIDYLKLSRNLHNLPPLQRSSFQRERPSPAAANSGVDPNAQIKSKLTAFIESLSQKLPEPNGLNNLQSKVLSSSSSSPTASISSVKSQPQLRKTSELLDTLQKALAQPLPPPPASVDPFSLLSEPPPLDASSIDRSQLLSECIKMSVCIEQAANLPKVTVKKCRNKRKSKGTPPQRAEYEPHVYATFEAATDHLNEKSLPPHAIKSHEGVVYCTSVIRGCNPEWNQSFEVFINFDVLKNPQKKFVVKVWRKGSHNPATTNAAPFEDSVVGFTAIDLSVLLTGLPTLSGYYNIVDFSGRCNGQLKISLKPLQDVSKFRNPESPLLPFMCPLNIDVNSTESPGDGSTLLSRTLKRKFTELDEITQRLRARLFDVTGDENFDPDEEFERDLNTAVVDDEEEDFTKEDFGWLKKDDEGNNLLMQTELNKATESQEPSSSKNSVLTRRDTGTGCSSSDEAMQQAPFAIDDLLKKYDLDTLINPNIFKNLLDPNLAHSDSTPTLVPKPAGEGNNDDNANDSDVTTVSSISNDQIQTIQKALQRTSLHDQSTLLRKDPDGHNNVSE